MGDAGRTYREILAYYYPGTTAGITAQGLTWNYAGGERVVFQTTRLSIDRRLIPIGDRLVRQIEQDTNIRFERRPLIRAYPTATTFRDSTGEPGWMAASSRGQTIRLQPTEVLAASLENTLEHELLHVLITESAAANLPAWFNEGLVLALSEPDRKITVPSRRAIRDTERSLQTPKRGRAGPCLSRSTRHSARVDREARKADCGCATGGDGLGRASPPAGNRARATRGGSPRAPRLRGRAHRRDPANLVPVALHGVRPSDADTVQIERRSQAHRRPPVARERVKW